MMLYLFRYSDIHVLDGFCGSESVSLGLQVAEIPAGNELFGGILGSGEDGTNFDKVIESQA